MSSIEDAIYSRLSGAAALTALVSTRIYPIVAPHTATSPFIIYELISETRVSAMSVDSPVVAALYQFSVFSDSAFDASNGVQAVCNQLRIALQRWAGVEATVTVQATFIVNVLDHPVDKETGLNHRTLDAKIFYLE